MKPIRRLAGFVLLTVLLTACGGDGGGESEASNSEIPQAVKACNPQQAGMEDITVDYSEDYVSAKTSEPSTSAQLAMVGFSGCVVEELDGPKSIAERYLNGSDGSETWGSYEANWSIGNSALFTIDAK